MFFKFRTFSRQHVFSNTNPNSDFDPDLIFDYVTLTSKGVIYFIETLPVKSLALSSNGVKDIDQTTLVKRPSLLL